MTTALDGTVIAVAKAATVKAALTTASANDVIIVFGATLGGSATLTAVTGTGLSFTQRKAATIASSIIVQEWYAVASSAFNNTIIATVSASTNVAVLAFGVSGADTNALFDTNAALPNVATVTAASITGTISTSFPNDFVFTLNAWVSTEASATVPAGFSLIENGTGTMGPAGAYEVSSATLNASTAQWKFPTSRAMVILSDALQPQRTQTGQGAFKSSAAVIAESPASGSGSFQSYVSVKGSYIQKFYWHDASSTDTGSLPSTTQSTLTVSATATGYNTVRSMDSNVGRSQVSAAVTDVNGTNLGNWMRLFASPPLASQTIGAGTWNLRAAMKVANINTSAQISGGCAYVWRPSMGTLVGVIFDTGTTPLGTSANTTETDTSIVNVSGTSVAVLNGDILVLEAWVVTIDAAVPSHTHLVTLYYDGTTEGSTTSNAAYLNAPAPIQLKIPVASGAGKFSDTVAVVGSGKQPGAGTVSDHVTAIGRGTVVGVGRFSSSVKEVGSGNAAGKGTILTKTGIVASGSGAGIGRFSSKVGAVGGGNAAGEGVVSSKVSVVGGGRGIGSGQVSSTVTATGSGKAAGEGVLKSGVIAVGGGNGVGRGIISSNVVVSTVQSGSATGTGVLGSSVTVTASTPPLGGSGKGAFSTSLVVFSYYPSSPDNIVQGVMETGGVSYVRVEAAPGIYKWNWDNLQGWNS